MAVEIQAPNDFTEYLNSETVLIFAGGSIEMNTAKQWQKRLVTSFKNEEDVVILNPRRADWNTSWKQVRSNKHFRQQVEWELAALEASNAIIMYFDPATKSPISLLETGLFAFDYGCTKRKLHVVCPKGFWRKGNVDIVCERYGVPQFSSLTAAIKHIKTHLDRYRYER